MMGAGIVVAFAECEGFGWWGWWMGEGWGLTPLWASAMVGMGAVWAFWARPVIRTEARTSVGFIVRALAIVLGALVLVILPHEVMVRTVGGVSLLAAGLAALWGARFRSLADTLGSKKCVDLDATVLPTHSRTEVSL